MSTEPSPSRAAAPTRDPGLAGERYTIRKRVLSVLGSSIEVFDERQNMIGFCRQKAFRLRESLTLYTDETKAKVVLTIQTRQIIDFGLTFEVRLADGALIGSLRRKGFRSIVRDEWHVLDPSGEQIGIMLEESSNLALLRRFIDLIAFIIPQVYNVADMSGRAIASLRTHRHLLVHKLGVTIHEQDAQIDDLMILALGCLLLAVEGREG